MQRLLTDEELPTKGITKYVRLALEKGESPDLIRRLVEDQIECFVEKKKAPRSFDQHLLDLLSGWGVEPIKYANQTELWRAWLATYATQTPTEKAAHDLIARSLEMLLSDPGHGCILSPPEL